MTVHLLRPEQTYCGKPVSLCGKPIEHLDVRLARGLRANCAVCLQLDREDDEAIRQLRNEPRDGEPSLGETR